MSKLRFAALVLAVVTTASSCGSSGDSDSDAGAGAASATVDGDVVAVGPAPVPGADSDTAAGDGIGSLGDAVHVAAAAPGDASVAACSIDRQTLETAVEAYEILNGAVPTSQQELFDAQLVREQSPRFEVGADGAVIAAPGSPCP